MERQNEYTIEADTSLNRLNMRLSGSFSEEETIPIINRINAEVSKLKPGFDIINDIRDLKKVNIKAALRIKKGTKILEEKGGKRLIRVVGSSKLAIQIFAKFASFKKSSMKVHYVPSIEEAHKILSSTS